MPSTSSDPIIGTVLDHRYDVTRRVARGGMATVYLATDRRLDRDVAVKIMHAHMVDDEQFVSRFIREAKSAARISHPNVVNVYDQGREGDVLYLVMEYVPGMTLRDVLNGSGPLTPGQALDVLLPVLDALAAAYRAGIVHRDVKPENVLLADNGQVKVADFGLARAVATSSRTSSSTGTLIGTPAYLSPELISRGVADVRSDVYSAGIMLFEMLVGHPPFEGDVPVQVAFRHVNEQVPSPSDEDPGLPRGLDELVEAATARDPDDRPRDAAAFAAMARQVLAGLTDAELDREPAAAHPGDTHASAEEPNATKVVDLRQTPQPSGLGRRTDPASRAPKRFPTVTEGLHGDSTTAMATQRLATGVPTKGPSTRELPQVSRTQAHGVRPQAHFPTDDAQQPRRRRRRAPVVILVLLLLATLGGVGSWYALAGPGAYTTMPAVSGTRAQVERELSAAGFTTVFKTAYNESVKAGTVVSTDPAGGQRIRKNGTVNVLLSKGTAWTTMPDVVGSTLEKATTTLRAQEISVRPSPEQVFHDTVKPGSVVTSQPAAKQRVQRGTSVTLSVSKGPAPVTVPDVGNQPQEQARKTLTDVGLRVKTAQEYSETVAQDNVIKQSPAGGGQAKRGDTVTLTISQGPPLVEVPSVMGKQVDEARQILGDAGFQVTVDNFMGGYFGTVRSQDPTPGSKAPKGSTIKLTVV